MFIEDNSDILIASVRPSCLKPKNQPKFGRLKIKFDDDPGSAKRSRKTKFGPTFYVFYIIRIRIPRSGIRDEALKDLLCSVI